MTLETGSRCGRRLSPTRRCLNPSRRSVSDYRSSNRTCRFPASGSPTGWSARVSERPIVLRKRLSVLHHCAAAFLPLGRSRRPRLALSRPAQDSLALRPVDLFGAPECAFCLRGFSVRSCPARCPDSYRVVPTLTRMELASTGSPCLSWHTLTASAHQRPVMLREAVGCSRVMLIQPSPCHLLTE